jgi:hypothetical protein
MASKVQAYPAIAGLPDVRRKDEVIALANKLCTHFVQFDLPLPISSN